MQIEGLRAMVVGGASGMARATAERIAKGGGKVAILDRAGSAGEEVASAIGGIYFECDIVDYEGIEKIIDLAVAELGGLDAAVNTAGGGIGKALVKKFCAEAIGPSAKSMCIRRITPGTSPVRKRWR